MDIKIEREYEFIPTFQGNDKSSSPMVFNMRQLTTAERDRMMDYTISGDGKPMMKLDRQGMFSAAVQNIRNLMVNGTTISTPKLFLEQPGLDAIYSEVVGNIIGKNGHDDLKNS